MGHAEWVNEDQVGEAYVLPVEEGTVSPRSTTKFRTRTLMGDSLPQGHNN